MFLAIGYALYSHLTAIIILLNKPHLAMRTLVAINRSVRGRSDCTLRRYRIVKKLGGKSLVRTRSIVVSSSRPRNRNSLRWALDWIKVTSQPSVITPPSAIAPYLLQTQHRHGFS